jgi:hypothetical protein
MSLELLLNTAIQNGAVIDERITFEKTQSSGISAFVTINNDTASNDTPISIDIPKSFIIKPEDAYRDLNVEAGKYEQTSVFKMYIASLKVKSIENETFQSYIDLLPSVEDIGSPLTLDHSALYVYENTTLQSSYISEKLQMLREEFIAVSAIREDVKFEDYLWAHLITTSRAFPYRITNPSAQPHEIMLLPIIDLLNHKPNSKVEWSSSERGNFKITCVSTPHDVKGKVEIFNNYGPKGNAELLMGYGFVIENNEFDSLQLSLSLNNQIKKGLLEEWNVKLPSVSDYTYSINDNKEGSTEDDGKDSVANDKTIFMLNKYHPIADGLLEVFAYISKNDGDTGLTLKNVMNGLNKLKQSLDLKYNEKLDKLPSSDESLISECDYVKAREFRKGQLKIYNMTKTEIKNKEKMYLKKYRKNFITIKDIIKKDKDFSDFLEILQWDKDVSEFSKMEMELLIRIWLLKSINCCSIDDNDTSFTNIDMRWFFTLFTARKELYQSGKNISIEADEFMVDMYNQIIPAVSTNAPELLKGNQWDLHDWLIVDELIIENSYEKGKSLEPLIIKPKDI